MIWILTLCVRSISIRSFFWSVFSGTLTERSDRFLLSSNVLSNSIYPLFSLKIAFSEILEKPLGFFMERDHFIRANVTIKVSLKFHEEPFF